MTSRKRSDDDTEGTEGTEDSAVEESQQDDVQTSDEQTTEQPEAEDAVTIDPGQAEGAVKPGDMPQGQDRAAFIRAQEQSQFKR